MIGFHNPVFGWHIIYLAVQRTNNKCMGKVIYFSRMSISILPEENQAMHTAFLGHEQLESFVTEIYFSLD